MVVHVAHDGLGLEPGAVVAESGLAAMRASAAVLGGELLVTDRKSVV